jgi:hypothetical protein
LLRHDWTEVKTLGDILQLLGTFVTAGGLIYAWERSTRRLSALRQSAQRMMDDVRATLTGRRDATVHAIVAESRAEGSSSVRIVVNHVVDPSLSVHRQIEGLAQETRDIREALANLQENVSRVENAPRLEPSDVDTAVSAALSTFKSELDTRAGTDYRYAIGGIICSFVGMVLTQIAPLIANLRPRGPADWWPALCSRAPPASRALRVSFADGIRHP